LIVVKNQCGTYEPWGLGFKNLMGMQDLGYFMQSTLHQPWVGYIYGDCDFSCVLEIKRMLNPLPLVVVVKYASQL
jgi:hypothetical protein